MKPGPTAWRVYSHPESYGSYPLRGRCRVVGPVIYTNRSKLPPALPLRSKLAGQEREPCREPRVAVGYPSPSPKSTPDEMGRVWMLNTLPICIWVGDGYTRKRLGMGRVSPCLPVASSPSTRQFLDKSFMSSLQFVRVHLINQLFFSASLIMCAPVQASKIPPHHDLAHC